MVSRKDFIKTLGLGGAGFALKTGQTGSASKPAKSDLTDKPNIVFMCGDQLRTQSTGYGGDPKARTPNMDRLASQGANFYNCVSSTPVCAAYRASVMTGKYASGHGMVINELRINNNQRCFGHVISEAGYNTGYFGNGTCIPTCIPMRPGIMKIREIAISRRDPIVSDLKANGVLIISTITATARITTKIHPAALLASCLFFSVLSGRSLSVH